MTDHADTVRYELRSLPDALAALDALVAERDEARRIISEQAAMRETAYRERDAAEAERDEARRQRDAAQERITTYAQEVVDRLVAAEAALAGEGDDRE